MKKVGHIFLRLLKRIKHHPIKSLLLLGLCLGYAICLPKTLFEDPNATVVTSNDGRLLGAKIAKDGQWRFPKEDSIPNKFKKCLLLFEDEYFYSHPGFNPVAISKAVWANIKAKKVVRGGSTITQQVIRLSRKGKSRTYLEKLWELILATRLEIRDSKEEILQLYAAHAPFGGNVVGLEMASWRYFGQSPFQLSWAESATLAVLPNAPGLIFPGKRQQQLKFKRDRLLQKLWKNEVIDSLTYQLSITEDLPQKPFAVPQIAPHMLAYIHKKHEGKRFKSTVDYDLQQQVNYLVQRHYNQLKGNEVHNMAVLVLDINSRQVKAYVGNAPTDKAHQKDVDMIHALRSTGSILKPLLYNAMLDDGSLLPESLVPDVPTDIAGYAPQNFELSYDGAVKANTALSRSLNIPAVRNLRVYGLQKFSDQLDYFKLRGINKSVDHYGLTLILGGAETNLWDLCKTYAALGGMVKAFTASSGEYRTNELINPILNKEISANFGVFKREKNLFDAGSTYLTLEALKEVKRPVGDQSWKSFESSQTIAWKTGTSFGHKDAWAIGLTPNYVVGVWVGNADGEGRPNVTGISAAAPLMFKVFGLLPKSGWFQKPYDDLQTVEVCAETGYLATRNCTPKTQEVSQAGVYAKACPYHIKVHLDSEQQFRVNASCVSSNEMVTKSWMVLPPLMAHYYKSKNVTYKPLPPYKPGCAPTGQSQIDFIYPKNHGLITLAKGVQGNYNEFIAKIAHYKPENKVFWYLDNTFLGSTITHHEIALLPNPGSHTLMVVDENGNEKQINFKVQ